MKLRNYDDKTTNSRISYYGCMPCDFRLIFKLYEYSRFNMNQNTTQYNHQEDEIDLRELFQTLWDRKVFIGVFTFIVTVCNCVCVYENTNL